ncbi:MAG: proton-conducting membrane transporter [Clostridia bacterium]|nr:proton-conducting membrane transporter [Clostridia bacterium]
MITGAFLAMFKQKGRNLDYTALGIAVITLGLTLLAVFSGEPGVDLVHITDLMCLKLRVDDIGRLFAILTSFMWVMAIMFSFEYMDHEGHKTRFYSFMLLSLGVSVGLPMAGNIITTYTFYELLTVLSMPLVIHSYSREAIEAGKKYLMYSFFGASLVLTGFLFLNHFGTTLDFTPGGVLDMAKVAGRENLVLLLFVLMFIGFSVKAGMFPLHAWLPAAHPIAPAPASALLSGVITKAGVVAIIRVTFYLFGADFVSGTWAHTGLLALSLVSIFLGSMLAYKENHFKRRLAYSSVSQLSYILFGIIILSTNGLTGALMHVVAHSAIKVTLFFVAGVLIFKAEIHHVDEVTGLGKSMPITMWCYSLVSLGLIGIPPTTGYVSKWFLAQGSLGLANQVLAYGGAAILLISALLTAGYLIPIFTDAFFPGKDFDYSSVKKLEPGVTTLAPMIILTAITLLVGMFPGPVLAFISNITKLLF